MWVQATSPLPLPCPSPSKTTATTSPRKLFSLVISAQYRQPPRIRKDHARASLGDQAVLRAFKSIPKHQPSSESIPHNSPAQDRPLSGSDVLWALRRATAEKSKKRRKDVSFTSRAPKNGNGQVKAAAAANCTCVRPLTINNEWMVRLEHLEKRLQQLTDD